MSNMVEAKGIKFPKWLIEMIQEVLDMRDAQKAYWEQPADYRLKKSRQKEAPVDDKLQWFVKEGHIEHKSPRQASQESLFK